MRALQLRSILVLALILAATVPPATAQYQEVPPEDYLMPGLVEGTGTEFAVTDSDGLNVTVSSTESIDITIHSVPSVILMDVAAAEGATSTQLTIRGMASSTTYHKYEDGLENHTEITTDEGGTCSLAQDLSSGHQIIIQPESSTHYIPYGLPPTIPPPPPSVGTWNEETRTYTLVADVDELLYLMEDNMTLDGADHSVIGSHSDPSDHTGVLCIGHTEVVVKNLNVQGFTNGIWLLQVAGGGIVDNTVSDCYTAIYPQSSSDLLVAGNQLHDNTWGVHNRETVYPQIVGNEIYDTTYSGLTLSGSEHCTVAGNSIHRSIYNYGIHLATSDDTTVTGNDISGFQLGIYVSSTDGLDGEISISGNTISECGSGLTFYQSQNITMNENTVTLCESGVELAFTTGCQIYNNNFIDSQFQAWVTNSTGNIFHLPKPTGGNYWSDWTSPDADGDGFVDTPYLFYGGQDDLPWAEPDGWLGVTAPGANVVVTPKDVATGTTPVTLAFDAVTAGGTTSVTLSGAGTPPPTGFRLGAPPTYYELSTTAAFDGHVEICIDYSGMSFGNESALTLMHYEDTDGDDIADTWVDRTLWLDTDNDMICALVDSFSEFALFEPGMEVSIDIKPGSDPNSMNLTAEGVIPVAILTTPEFDASSVDTSLDENGEGRVSFSGASAKIKGKSGSYSSMEDVDGDGDLDLVVHFYISSIDQSLFEVDGETTYATIAGRSTDGVAVVGRDAVLIVQE